MSNVVKSRIPETGGRMTVEEASDKLRGLPRPVAQQIGDFLGEICTDAADISKMIGDTRDKP